MNEQGNEKWLDELISRSINTEKPQFDSEKWKQEYPDEYQTLISRKATTSPRAIQWANILKSSITKFAAAAVIIVAISFFVFHKEPLEQQRSQKVIVTKSPAEMLTLRSLKIAYRNGGIEAVETQCEKAIEKLGLKPERISVQELLEDIIGT